MTAPRDIADIAAELETIRQLQADTKTQLARTRNTIRLKQQEIGALEVHEYALVTAIDQRGRKADRLLDEMLRMQQTALLDAALAEP